jgi:hypothetical protein
MNAATVGEGAGARFERVIGAVDDDAAAVDREHRLGFDALRAG